MSSDSIQPDLDELVRILEQPDKYCFAGYYEGDGTASNPSLLYFRDTTVKGACVMTVKLPPLLTQCVILSAMSIVGGMLKDLSIPTALKIGKFRNRPSVPEKKPCWWPSCTDFFLSWEMLLERGRTDYSVSFWRDLPWHDIDDGEIRKYTGASMTTVQTWRRRFDGVDGERPKKGTPAFWKRVDWKGIPSNAQVAEIYGVKENDVARWRGKLAPDTGRGDYLSGGNGNGRKKSGSRKSGKRTVAA